jgi:hypothetical protein
MLQRVYVHGMVERAAGKPLRIVAANEGRQADGIDLRMEGADLGRYLANPIIGYGHDYWGREGLPIGRAVSTAIEGAQLVLVPEFDKDDPFAVEVERKLRAGYLNAVSIGFDVHDVSEVGIPARWELFETSVVPIPMDAGALVAARADRGACPHCPHQPVPAAAEPVRQTENRGAGRRRSQLIRARARARLEGAAT